MECEAQPHGTLCLTEKYTFQGDRFITFNFKKKKSGFGDIPARNGLKTKLHEVFSPYQNLFYDKIGGLYL